MTISFLNKWETSYHKYVYFLLIHVRTNHKIHSVPKRYALPWQFESFKKAFPFWNTLKTLNMKYRFPFPLSDFMSLSFVLWPFWMWLVPHWLLERRSEIWTYSLAALLSVSLWHKKISLNSDKEVFFFAYFFFVCASSSQNSFWIQYITDRRENGDEKHDYY